MPSALDVTGRGRVARSLDRQQVPAVLRNSLYLLLLTAGVLSVPYIGQYGPLPTTTLLDAWIIAFIVACVVRGRTVTIGVVILLVTYLLSRVLPALAMVAPVLDFLQAYRWVLYLIALTLAIGRNWGPVRPLVRVMWALLAMALVKSVLTYFIAGEGERPGLLLENNFELALFCGLAVVLYPFVRHRLLLLIGVGALTVLSGSRSGAVAFVLFAVFALLQVRSKGLAFQYFFVCALPVLLLIPAAIFGERSQQDARIDRLNFFDVFLNETSSWNWLQWVFGTPPITPLSPAGCTRLSYYVDLFASTGDGSCYSVILHAFVMRVVFDAGLVGLVLAFFVPTYVLRRSEVNRTLSATLMLIALTNSLSVSGLNNPYVAFPILLAVLTTQRVRLSGGNEDVAPRPVKGEQVRFVRRRREVAIETI